MLCYVMFMLYIKYNNSRCIFLGKPLLSIILKTHYAIVNPGRWSVTVTCGRGAALGGHGVELAAVQTHAEEGALHVLALRLAAHPAQQLALVDV